MNELALARRVTRNLKARAAAGEPLWFLKVVGSPRQRGGVPDYLICYFGRFVAVELKHPTDRSSTLTPLQRRERLRMVKARAMYAVCRNETEVDALLTAVRVSVGGAER